MEQMLLTYKIVPVMDCPFCEHGSAVLKQESRTFVVRDELVPVNYLFYECDCCKEQFTTTASDEVWYNQIKKDDTEGSL